MTEFNNGGYLPSAGRWSKPVAVVKECETVVKPEKVLTDKEWAEVQKTQECNCEPEEFEGELIHWSSCPKNEGGCKDGACSL